MHIISAIYSARVQNCAAPTQPLVPSCQTHSAASHTPPGPSARLPSPARPEASTRTQGKSHAGAAAAAVEGTAAPEDEAADNSSEEDAGPGSHGEGAGEGGGSGTWPGNGGGPQPIHRCAGSVVAGATRGGCVAATRLYLAAVQPSGGLSICANTKPRAGPDPGSDSSEDERPNRNTVGNVPLVWYKDEEHIG